MAQLTAVSSPVVQRHTSWMRRGRDHVRQGRDHVRQARDHVRRNRNHVRQGGDHVRQSAARSKVPVCKCIDHPGASNPRTFATAVAAGSSTYAKWPAVAHRKAVPRQNPAVSPPCAVTAENGRLFPVY